MTRAILDRGRWLAVVVAIAIVVIGVGSALGEGKKVSGTRHDVATPGSAVCTYCHVPRDPGDEVLWESGGEGGTEVERWSVKSLCFSCHDGTVTATGSYVFDPNRPQHPSTAGFSDQDCTRCHDPHDDGQKKFLKLPGDANFCQNCHSRAGPMNHPVNIDPHVSGIVPLDEEFDPGAGDFSGTRLWNPQGDGPGNIIKCLTCHSPHGGQPGSEINTVAVSGFRDPAESICQNCHTEGP